VVAPARALARRAGGEWFEPSTPCTRTLVTQAAVPPRARGPTRQGGGRGFESRHPLSSEGYGLGEYHQGLIFVRCPSYYLKAEHHHLVCTVTLPFRRVDLRGPGRSFETPCESIFSYTRQPSCLR